VIGVTGPYGRLGSELVRRGCLPLDCNITSVESIRATLEAAPVPVIINAAAYTDVDGCEEPENQAKAVAVNTRGPGLLRQQFSGFLIHISTGYVFDGTDGPYAENAAPNPISFYGMSKLGGEAAVQIGAPTLIVRVLDLFGHGPKSDFVRQIRDHLTLKQPIELPANLYGSPTYIPHLAAALMHLAQTGPNTPILHVAGDAVLSRFRWAQMIAAEFGLDAELVLPTDITKGKAERPMRGGLIVDSAKAMGVPIRSAIEGLRLIREAEASIGTS
jgi:dTDP-4-dehydrorhamnose reductase